MHIPSAWRSLARSYLLGTLMCIMALLAITPAVALADVRLDQSQTQISLNGFEAGVGATQVAAQVFTAGITGSLDRVDVYLAMRNHPGDLLVQIQPLSSVTNKPTGSSVASATVSETALGLAQDVPQWIAVSFTAPAEVVANTQYALVLSAPSGLGSNFYMWFESSAFAYARGPALLSVDSGLSWPPYSMTDYVFRTYVAAVAPPPVCDTNCVGGGPNPQSTPELDSFLLFAGGISGLGSYVLTRRRSRRASARERL